MFAKFAQTSAQSTSQTAAEASEAVIDPARVAVIGALAETDADLSLPELRRKVAGVSSDILARALRNAALDGLVEIDGARVSLTSLGRNVARMSPGLIDRPLTKGR